MGLAKKTTKQKKRQHQFETFPRYSRYDQLFTQTPRWFAGRLSNRAANWNSIIEQMCEQESIITVKNMSVHIEQ